MIDTWFTADTHFGHKNILSYENSSRGMFSSMEEHDEELIKRWNSVVKKNDNVYHLGDFCLNRKMIPVLADRLKGYKRLILGNHDLYPTQEYLICFPKLYACLAKAGFIMTHIPIHPSHTRWELNVHGHLHSNKVQLIQPFHPSDHDDPQYLCVSVEQNDLTPIHLDVIFERLKQIQS